MRVLITGIAGFVGSYVAELLLAKKGVAVYGIDSPGADTKNIDRISSRLKLYRGCDIRMKHCLKNVLSEVKPDCILHLAAQSSPLLSEQYPEETVAVNVIGEVNIFEALSKLKLKPRVIIAGSCDEYGFVAKKEMPIKENCKLKPYNLYSLTKVTQELLGLNFYNRQGYEVIITRPFHTVGPKRPERFVCSSLAKQIAMVEKRMQEPVIYVGNTDVARDFTDVRDVASAYWMLIRRGRPGEAYNICSGKAYSIEEVLAALLCLSKVKVKVKVDTTRIRAKDVPLLIGSYAKLHKLTGWKPCIPLKSTLEDLLKYWRTLLK